MSIKAYVLVKLQVEGIHRRADCPIESVEFLRNNHRHIFHIEATKEVSHDDRDIEIIMLKRSIEKDLKVSFGTPCEFGEMSCEMIARLLIDRYGLSSCSVLEDDENGALLVNT